MTTINIRADESLKIASNRILDEMGLDMSSAVKLFLQQVVITKSIPFKIKTCNGFTPKEEAKLLKERQSMKKAILIGKLKVFASSEDMVKDLLK